MALISTKLIVLNTLKYGDNSLIVKCYTASDGLRTYFLKGILSRKKSKIKKAHFQPLMQLEVIANHRDNENLDFIREVKIDYAYKTLHSNVYKNAIVFFLAEFLTNALKEETENEGLYPFIAHHLQLLDSLEQFSNFHFVFLINLSHYLGFYPDISNQKMSYFNLESGVFEAIPSSNNSLTNKELVLFKSILGINFDTMNTVRYLPEEKQILIDVLIRYFSVHLTTFKKLKSVAILHEVLH
jgi:DNA repair protein RecO (recombination protein O)